MKSLTRMFHFEGYKTLDVAVSTKGQFVRIELERSQDKVFECSRCHHPLTHVRGRHSLKLETLEMMGYRTEIKLWRLKGHCSSCKKARSEQIEFISPETPHMTKALSEFLGQMCEFAAVSRVAKFTKRNDSTIRNVDYKRLKRLLGSYKIPAVQRIAVDEVYARKKPRHFGEKRTARFFTVITDLDTRRVIWVSEGRSKEALDTFFILIGEKACKKIVVAAMDQFDGYAASTKEFCPNATVVWDKFHIMQNFEEAINETRKDLHDTIDKKDPLFPLTRGKYRYLFLKKSSRRDKIEQQHIDSVLDENEDFAKLEIIKERMLSFFNEPNAEEAKIVLEQMTMWAYEAGFQQLIKWFKNANDGWNTMKNYFDHRVTSALAEGMNNVIKALKRQAFGYRDMDYFRYKIMQKCGYLNSDYIQET